MPLISNIAHKENGDIHKMLCNFGNKMITIKTSVSKMNCLNWFLTLCSCMYSIGHGVLASLYSYMLDSYHLYFVRYFSSMFMRDNSLWIYSINEWHCVSFGIRVILILFHKMNWEVILLYFLNVSVELIIFLSLICGRVH